MIIDILLTLVLITLIYIAILFRILWPDIRTYLIWNTRYQGVEYEGAVTRRKSTKPPGVASKTESKGRSIKPVDDLVDITELDFETGYKALEALGVDDGSKG